MGIGLVFSITFMAVPAFCIFRGRSIPTFIYSFFFFFFFFSNFGSVCVRDEYPLHTSHT